jgi:azurin
MQLSSRRLSILFVLGLALVLAACGGDGGNTGGGGEEASGGSGATTIEIGSDGENLAFDKTDLEVAAGQEVTLVFQNNSAVQEHNWILVDGGEDVAAPIAEAGLTAGVDNEYLGEDRSNVLAHTTVAAGGETVEVTFTAPASGTYLYICTVPGHYPLMQGTLTVK